MLSQKNKNKLFVYEEEIDQTQDKVANIHNNNTNTNNPSGNLTLRSNKENLADSLENVAGRLKESSNRDKDLIIKLGGEDYKLERENSGMILNYLKTMKGIYDTKVNINYINI
jgi:hypothetical protein